MISPPSRLINTTLGVNRLLSFWNRNQAHGEIVYKNGDKVIYDFTYFNIATERINDARLNQQTGGD